jgi:hypothetical protein
VLNEVSSTPMPANEEIVSFTLAGESHTAQGPGRDPGPGRGGRSDQTSFRPRGTGRVNA